MLVFDIRWRPVVRRGAFVCPAIPAWYAPFGIAALGGDLEGRLVASFGSGRINAYARRGRGWKFRGRLPVRVPGVWGIAFGTGGMSGPRTTLFYAAGPHRWHGASEVDVHGVLGVIGPA